MLEDITIKEFISLNEWEQGDALWEYGELVGHRIENDHSILLYQISNFYVEVKYNNEANFIAELFPFENTDLLEPYLRQIDLKGI